MGFKKAKSWLSIINDNDKRVLSCFGPPLKGDNNMEKVVENSTAFLARRYPPLVEEKIKNRYRVRCNNSDSRLSVSQLTEQARGCEVLFVSVTESLPRSVFDALSDTLRVVATLSVGVDHIDLGAAKEYGVKVLHSPDVLSDACAEVGMMLMLNAARRGHEADRMVRSGRWTGWGPTQLLGKELTGKKLGILGMGRIGQAFAERARAFKMVIHYHNRHRLDPSLECGAIYHETVDSLLVKSEFFSINAPGSDSLKGFLNQEKIQLLPKGAVVINISRGDVVDDDALIQALKNGHLFSAGLDVFKGEPDIDPRYAELENIYLSPHIGSATTETRNAMGFMLIDGLDELKSGQRPTNCII
jgi:glyoxylate reductase|tara:strand:+ start:22650 stop:23723 length:1074 start_codon:yes stop_codon:yes gene_type:complete